MKNIICIVLALFVVSGLVSAQTKIVDAVKEVSSVTYKLVHPLHEIEATSKEVIYKVEIDPAIKKIKSVSAQVDVTTFDSGNSNRDSHAMEVIDAITYPDVIFNGTEVEQNGDSLHVTGKLTFHGVTNDIVMAGTSHWLGDTLKIDGNFNLSLTAFKIERPSLLMIPVKDTLFFTLKASFELK